MRLVNLGSEAQPLWVRINSIESVEHTNDGMCTVSLRNGRVYHIEHPVSEVLETIQQAAG